MSGNMTEAVAPGRVDSGKHFMHWEQENEENTPHTSCTVSLGKNGGNSKI